MIEDPQVTAPPARETTSGSAAYAPTTTPETYEVTADRRRWQITLTPEGRVLKVKYERRSASANSYFHTSWQRAPGSWPSPQGPSGEAVRQALRLQRDKHRDLLAPREELAEAERGIPRALIKYASTNLTYRLKGITLAIEDVVDAVERLDGSGEVHFDPDMQNALREHIANIRGALKTLRDAAELGVLSAVVAGFMTAVDSL